MTPKLSLITVVAGAALLLAAPAWGSAQPAVSPDDTSVQSATAQQQALDAVKARSDALNRQYGLGEYAPVTEDRSEALNRRYGLGEYAPPAPDALERAVANRGTGSDGFLSGDDHVRLAPADLPTIVVATSPSGREVEWPQIGVGFGIGLLLMLGLVFALRVTRVRPLAH